MTSPTIGKIQIVSAKGVGMIFNANDYIRIRRDYRITGNLVGVTAGHPNDSTIRGLPAVYSPFELKILVDEGVVEITSTPTSVEPWMQDEYKEFVECQRKAQKEKWTIIDREMTDGDLWYQIPTECLFRDDPRRSKLVVPVPLPDPVKYQVYRDLWSRKFFITNGHSFGGDFLIYPQDPIVCHATHVVHVLDKPRVNIKDFITINRLCVGVKKECLFAYPENGDRIIYQNSAWDSTWNK